MWRLLYNNNNDDNKGPLIFSVCHMHMRYIIVHCTTVSDIRRYDIIDENYELIFVSIP